MPALARTTDPETSHEAAATITSEVEALAKATAIEILKDAGVPLTDFEIADRWDAYWKGSHSESLPRKARHFAREDGHVMHAGFGEHEGHRVRTWTLGYDHEFCARPICPTCGRRYVPKKEDDDDDDGTAVA